MTKSESTTTPPDSRAPLASADLTRPQAADAGAGPLSGRELVVCVCGGIAAYKTAAAVSGLAQLGAGVTVAMTRNARRFIAPLTFQALTGRRVHTSSWREPTGDIQHLELTRRADLALVAPATANILAKLAGGLADDLVSSMLLGAACPVALAPAMNSRMWTHPATQRNVDFLRAAGYAFVGPEEGWQACREVGAGRMSEPQTLVAFVSELLRAARRGSASG